MATNKVITVTTIPTRTGDTVASYNAYSSVDGLLGSLSVAEAAAGKTFALSDGSSHNITVKTVWVTAGESTSNVSNIVVVDLGAYILDLNANSFAAYSLRKLKSTATYAVTVRRDNDNSTTDVELEASGSIDLNSTVSAGGTLGTWVGSNSAFVTKWYDQSGQGNDVINTLTPTEQFYIVNSGSLVTKSALSALTTSGITNPILSRAAMTELNDASSFSAFSVAANEAVETIGTIFTTTNLAGDKLSMFNDSRTTPYRSSVIVADSVTYNADMSVSRANTNNILQSLHSDGNIYTPYDNGALGVAVTPVGTYSNVAFQIGRLLEVSTQTDMTIQELILFSTDKTADRVSIEANINSYYTIF